jgi:hypothetical protein
VQSLQWFESGVVSTDYFRVLYFRAQYRSKSEYRDSNQVSTSRGTHFCSDTVQWMCGNGELDSESPLSEFPPCTRGVIISQHSLLPRPAAASPASPASPPGDSGSAFVVFRPSLSGGMVYRPIVSECSQNILLQAICWLCFW